MPVDVYGNVLRNAKDIQELRHEYIEEIKKINNSIVILFSGKVAVSDINKYNNNLPN